jgi:hypothetical protein
MDNVVAMKKQKPPKPHQAPYVSQKIYFPVYALQMNNSKGMLAQQLLEHRVGSQDIDLPAHPPGHVRQTMNDD